MSSSSSSSKRPLPPPSSSSGFQEEIIPIGTAGASKIARRFPPSSATSSSPIAPAASSSSPFATSSSLSSSGGVNAGPASSSFPLPVFASSASSSPAATGGGGLRITLPELHRDDAEAIEKVVTDASSSDPPPRDVCVFISSLFDAMRRVYTSADVRQVSAAHADRSVAKLHAIARAAPHTFVEESVLKKIYLLMSRENMQGQPRIKTASLASATAALLTKALVQLPTWPVSIANVIITDTLNDRLWVDCEQALEISRSFLASLPSYDANNALVWPADGKFSHLSSDDQFQVLEQSIHLCSNAFTSNSNSALPMPVSISSSPSVDSSAQIKNVVRILPFILPLSSQIRLQTALNIENWMNNPTMMRFAKDAMDYLSQFCREESEADTNAITALFSLKLKPAFTQQYSDCVLRVIQNNDVYPIIAMRHFIWAETQIGVNKGVSNFKLLMNIIRQFDDKQKQKSQHLDAASGIMRLEEAIAIVLHQATSAESSRPQMRFAVRRLLRTLLMDFPDSFDATSFCMHMLLQERTDAFFMGRPPRGSQEDKEQWMLLIIDISVIALILASPGMIQGATPSSSSAEQSSSSSPSNVPSQPEISAFVFSAVERVQSRAMEWLLTAVSTHIPSISSSHLCTILRRLLFLEPSLAHYYPLFSDRPTDSEKASLFKCFSQLPVSEDSLIRLIFLSLTYERSLPRDVALDLLQSLIIRAAALQSSLEAATPHHALAISNPQILEALFKLSVFSPPSHQYPLEEFSPPEPMAMKQLFWQAAILATIIASFSPQTIGLSAYSNIPTVRRLMERVIKNRIRPLESDGSGASGDSYADDEPQELVIHEAQIINQYVNDCIQKTSLLNMHGREDVTFMFSPSLTSSLMLLDVAHHCRVPPTPILDKLKQISQEHNLGGMLRKCRDPDFLADIMQREGGAGVGNENLMAWLRPLMRNESEILDALPISVLAELCIQEMSSSAKEANNTEEDMDFGTWRDDTSALPKDSEPVEIEDNHDIGTVDDLDSQQRKRFQQQPPSLAGSGGLHQRIRQRLSHCLWNAEPAFSSQVLLTLLPRLSNGSRPQRRAAHHFFSSTLLPSEGQHWVSKILLLSCWDYQHPKQPGPVSSAICSHLLNALLKESNPQSASHVLQFVLEFSCDHPSDVVCQLYEKRPLFSEQVLSSSMEVHQRVQHTIIEALARGREALPLLPDIVAQGQQQDLESFCLICVASSPFLLVKRSMWDAIIHFLAIPASPSSPISSSWFLPDFLACLRDFIPLLSAAAACTLSIRPIVPVEGQLSDSLAMNDIVAEKLKSSCHPDIAAIGHHFLLKSAISNNQILEKPDSDSQSEPMQMDQRRAVGGQIDIVHSDLFFELAHTWNEKSLEKLEHLMSKTATSATASIHLLSQLVPVLTVALRSDSVDSKTLAPKLLSLAKSFSISCAATIQSCSSSLRRQFQILSSLIERLALPPPSSSPSPSLWLLSLPVSSSSLPSLSPT